MDGALEELTDIRAIAMYNFKNVGHMIFQCVSTPLANADFI